MSRPSIQLWIIRCVQTKIEMWMCCIQGLVFHQRCLIGFVSFFSSSGLLTAQGLLSKQQQMNVTVHVEVMPWVGSIRKFTLDSITVDVPAKK